MSMARKRRRAQQWFRYTSRWITPERGGMLDNVEPIGFVKALYRAHREPWSSQDPITARQMRRSR